MPTGVERWGAEEAVVCPRAGEARFGGTEEGAGARFGGIVVVLSRMGEGVRSSQVLRVDGGPRCCSGGVWR